MRADLVNRLAAAGLPRVEAVSFVRADRVPQMAGAEEVVEGIERRDGTEYSGLVLNEQGSSASPPPGSTASTRRSARPRSSTAATPTPRLRRRPSGSTRPGPGARAGDRHDQRRVRLPVRRACRPRPRERARRPLRGRGGRPRGHDRRRRAERGARARRAHEREGLPRAQHAQHGLCERARGARGGRHGSRRLGRGARRLPLRAPGERQHRDRGPGVPPRARRGGDRDRPRRADPGPRSGSKGCSAGGSKASSTARGRFRASRDRRGSRRAPAGPRARRPRRSSRPRGSSPCSRGRSAR